MNSFTSLLLIAMIAVLLSSANRASALQIDRLAPLSNCEASIDHVLAPIKSKRAPSFSELHDLVSWTYMNLPKDARHGFDRAGHRLAVSADQSHLNAMARDPVTFQNHLRMLAAEELGRGPEFPSCRSMGYVVQELVINDLGVSLNLYEPPTASLFNQIGLTDTYEIQNAFLMMLVLRASGLTWQASWLEIPASVSRAVPNNSFKPKPLRGSA